MYVENLTCNMYRQALRRPVLSVPHVPAQILSMDGYGTDAYLHLNRLGNVQEPLP